MIVPGACSDDVGINESPVTPKKELLLCAVRVVAAKVANKIVGSNLCLDGRRADVVDKGRECTLNTCRQVEGDH